MVLAVLVAFPCARRPGARPVLGARDRPPPDNPQRGRRRPPPAQRWQVLRRRRWPWFPDGHVVFAGAQTCGSQAMAALARRTQGRLHRVRKFYPHARLDEPPPADAGHGRPRVKGAGLPGFRPANKVNQSEGRKGAKSLSHTYTNRDCLMILGIDPKVDYAFKHMLGRRVHAPHPDRRD